MLSSPLRVAIQVLNDASGTVKGSASLRSYFKRCLELYPNLQFELIDVLCRLSSIVLYYRNQKGTKTGEFMEFAGNGKVVRVVANYSV